VTFRTAALHLRNDHGIGACLLHCPLFISSAVLCVLGILDMRKCIVLSFTALLAIMMAPGSSGAAVRCPFITDQQLTDATSARWSLISNQDGRGCIYTGENNDTLMVVVFRNPNADRAKELYATFVKTLSAGNLLRSRRAG
jgi:hypothetical protein